MYLSFYQLKDEPFRLTPDPRYLHLTEPHHAALTVLLEGIFYRKGLVMITGPIGTGKTTLVHTALQVIMDKKMPLKSALLFNPVLSRDEFLEMMLEEFEVTCTATSKPRRLAALHQMLLETQKAGGTAVLFVDEAHLLTPELLEEIRLLGNADTHDGKLLQIVLSGQPELLAMMKRPELSAFHQRIAARAHLRPLSLPETRVYVAERLHAAGLQGASPFAPHTLESIHGYSTGVPRLINLICDGCLSLGFRAQLKTIQPDLVEEMAESLGLNTVEEVEVAPAPMPAPKRVMDLPTVVEPRGAMEMARSIAQAAERAAAAAPRVPVSQETGADILNAGAPAPAVQKTAVDMLIESMKQRRTPGRGASSNEQVF